MDILKVAIIVMLVLHFVFHAYHHHTVTLFRRAMDAKDKLIQSQKDYIELLKKNKL
jgi:hypothetical protein